VKNLLNKLKLNEIILAQVNERLKSFALKNKQGNKEWFNELCFCLLTANSKASTALKIEAELTPNGFAEKPIEEIKNTIKNHGHRFYNKKAEFIVQARKFLNIKDKLNGLNSSQARMFLVKNIKGLGYKEASHFLRNVGFNDVAIIDRHILRFLNQENLVNFINKMLTPKFYLECEQILKSFQVPLDKLDLMIWAYVTGKVLK